MTLSTANTGTCDFARRKSAMPSGMPTSSVGSNAAATISM
jgi:hypothetical protein